MRSYRDSVEEHTCKNPVRFYRIQWNLNCKVFAVENPGKDTAGLYRTFTCEYKTEKVGGENWSWRFCSSITKKEHQLASARFIKKVLETAKGAACDPMSMTLPGIEKKNEPRLILTTILIIINRIFYRVPFSQFFKGLYNIKTKKV